MAARRVSGLLLRASHSEVARQNQPSESATWLVLLVAARGAARRVAGLSRLLADASLILVEVQVGRLLLVARLLLMLMVMMMADVQVVSSV